MLTPTPKVVESNPQGERRPGQFFGSNPERYDRTRPKYPDAMIERLVKAFTGPNVLDVGCGTGVVALQLQKAGCAVLGVEPDMRMAEVARRGGIDVEIATFEAWGLAGRQFDAVVSGTAWHWVDPVMGAAKAASALRPGGMLAPFWHVFEPPPEVAEGFAAAYRRVEPGSPMDARSAGTLSAFSAGPNLAAYQVLFDNALIGIRQVGRFNEPERWRFDSEQSYTRDEWLEQMTTFGPLLRLPGHKRAQILENVGSVIDGMGGAVNVTCITVLFTATCRAGKS
ncbi:class I SAM-dependent methyltransferase [Micromonospora sp. DT4]|uniref:class I SAM-dependent methyltransferase n=1 Tax=Micromonospora sp. DT4 TaxID=3393438 RepID=UPI003CEAF752